MIRFLTVTAFVLAAFNALLWHEVLAGETRAPIVQERQENIEAYVSAPVEELAPRESIGMPVRISIPSIAVDAPIENVALAADGSMDIPKDPFDTAWYELGARPGETGSAAITGHVDWKNGAAAVFADLHKVRTGDKIEVLDDKGDVISFVVRETRRYAADADATDVFTSDDGKAHLNVITCGGEWDEAAKQYKERLVVFTDKETE